MKIVNIVTGCNRRLGDHMEVPDVAGGKLEDDLTQNGRRPHTKWKTISQKNGRRTHPKWKTISPKIEDDLAQNGRQPKITMTNN